MRGTWGEAPLAPDVRHRGGGGGVAHSTGTGQRRIGGIMRKRPGVQCRGNPPMCRATRSAHGSPSAKNRHSRKIPGIARKTPNRSAGEPLSNVQHRRAGREEPEPGRPARPRCQTPPRGPGRVPRRRPRSRQMKQHPPQSVREDSGPPGSGPPSDPAGSSAPPEPRGRPHPPHRPRSLGRRSWRERCGALRCFRERSSRPLRSALLLRIPTAPNNVIPVVSE